jgi:hypothetical protein
VSPFPEDEWSTRRLSPLAGFPNISINWPHHVFVSKDFKVLGYE